jgi:hypothetical protein
MVECQLCLTLLSRYSTAVQENQMVECQLCLTLLSRYCSKTMKSYIEKCQLYLTPPATVIINNK